MSARIRLITEEDRLDISFEGNLDLTVWSSVYDACIYSPPNLRICIVDLTEVGRVFDSGVAILGLLYQHMQELGTTVIFVSDDLELRQRIAAIASPLWHQTSSELVVL